MRKHIKYFDDDKQWSDFMLHKTPAEIAIYDNYDTSDDDYDNDQNICCKIYLQK